ncbi:gp10 [Rhodococcus phage ReqiPine5]|uniref:Gp10 n=1 Tax=Rhodococcus phage ReqiPine5 TaxID=691963 RepID=D4P7Y5_9CAUD|nr:gp10 [Rhodococcus phage ReqiPine5]ADD81115.1 gp10 [Rhodococcus phage ReqiPine5]
MALIDTYRDHEIHVIRKRNPQGTRNFHVKINGKLVWEQATEPSESEIDTYRAYIDDAIRRPGAYAFSR